MKRTLFLIIVIYLLAVPSGFAQDAGNLISDFESALIQNKIEPFIASHSISNALLQRLVDEENQNMGIADDDPTRFTLEQAQMFMDQMKRNLTSSFLRGREALGIISDISPEVLGMTDFTVQKSYWEPPVIEVSILFAAEEKEVNIRISNLNLENNSPKLGPSSRIEFAGYQAQDVIAYHITKAMQNEDAVYFANMVLPDAVGLQKLLDTMAESGGFSPDETPETLLRQIRERVIADFRKLIETGTEKGILWNSISNIWSGYSAELRGDVYLVSIPFEFTSNGTGYRVVLENCSQLASDLSVFLPGAFAW